MSFFFFSLRLFFCFEILFYFFKKTNEKKFSYNSFVNYNNKVYINIKKKCFIENYDEKLLSIKNVENENITYIYDKKEYVVSFWDDIYLIDSSPFSC